MTFLTHYYAAVQNLRLHWRLHHTTTHYSPTRLNQMMWHPSTRSSKIPSRHKTTKMDTGKQQTAGTASETISHEMTAIHPDANSTLRQEALDLLSPYVSPSNAPHPFTTAELVCLVILLLNERAVSKAQVFQYICTNIAEYNQCAIKIFAFGLGDLESVLAGFDSVFEQYESPLRQVQTAQQATADDGWNSDIVSRERQVREEWTVDLRAARIFLGDHLAPVRAGNLRFLEFPPEIRTAIYEHVLQTPPLKLSTAWGSKSCEVDHPAEESFNDCRPLGCTPRSINETLAVVFTCRQVYREALPVFYGAIRLRCTDVEALAGLMRSLCANHPERVPDRHPLCTPEPIRLHCLKTLHIDYRGESSYRSRNSIADPFADLVFAKALRHLTITVHERYWRALWVFDFEPIEEPSDLPHMGSLVRLLSRVGSYELQGDNVKIRRYIEAELEKVKNAMNNK